MIIFSLLILIIILSFTYRLKNSFLNSLLITRVTSIIFLFSGALTFNALYIQLIGSGIGLFSGFFQITIISQLLETFIYIISSIILISWPIKIKNNLINNNILNNSINNNLEISEYSKYSLLVLFSSLGAGLLLSCSDLISIYISIELQSFALYILATIYRDLKSATAAGLKYFLLGGFSSCLILLGSGLIYTYTGLTNLESIYSLVSVSNNIALTQGLSLGIILFFIGFLFKIASAPFHNWAPDVYNNSPTIITTWLTIMPKISILILLLEIQIGIGISIYQFINSTELLSNYNNIQLSILEISNNIINKKNILIEINTVKILTNFILICSLLSLLIGTIVGISQIYIKRLFAFSTISHIGFLLLALAINNQQSIESFLFYLIQYSITSLNIFLIILALGYKHFIVKFSIKNNKFIIEDLDKFKNKFYSSEIKYDLNYLTELKGMFYNNPLLSICLSLSLFSFAGIPPLLGFFAKQQILLASTGNGNYFISIVAILTSVISAFYYIRIIRILHSESSNSDDQTVLLESLLSNTHSFVISTLTLIILFFIFYPVLILNSLKILTLSIFI